MKRTASVAILSVCLTIVGAATALAANYPPTPGGGGGQSGPGTSNTGGLASTGSNVTLGMILVVALIAVGLTALIVGRRRSRV
ncbi:MAG: hypothetical protein ACJ76P_07925 [Actinomycetota bacterium]